MSESSSVSNQPEKSPQPSSIFSSNPYISQKGLHALKSYKFCAITDSPVENYIFNPFWNKIVQYVPKSVAPNTITIAGLIACLIAYSLITSFSEFYSVNHPHSSSSFTAVQCPPWVYFTTSFLFFCYITFDGIDGKQARRTHSASPLGEVVDHGVDGMVCTIMALTMNVCCSVGLNRLTGVAGNGSNPPDGMQITSLRDSFAASWAGDPSATVPLADDFDLLFTYLNCLVLYIGFYLVTWESYHTGTLYFGWISVIEGELAVCALLIISALYGTDAWVTPLGDLLVGWGFVAGTHSSSTGGSFFEVDPNGLIMSLLGGIQLKHILCGIELIMAVINTVQSIRNMYPCWRDGTYSLFSLWMRSLPVQFLVVLSATWIWTSPSNVLLRYNHQLLWTVGLIHEDALVRFRLCYCV